MTETITTLRPVKNLTAVEKKERIHRRADLHEEDFDEFLNNSRKRKRKRKDGNELLLSSLPSDGEALFQLMFQAENLHEPFEDASRIYTSAEKKAGEKIDIIR